MGGEVLDERLRRRVALEDEEFLRQRVAPPRQNGKRGSSRESRNFMAASVRERTWSFS